MLVIHPTSQCDICLDAYTWATPAKAPHAIQCGHIFCYDCLRTVNPSNCPMCRKAFNPDRIKRLHVDKAPGESVSASSSRMSEENDFMRRVGLLFGEGSEEDINSLVKEVTSWLNVNAGPSHQPLRHVITALHQYKALQSQHVRDEATITQLHETHDRHAHVKQRDLDLAMKVESGILEEQEKLRTEYEAKLASVEAELTLLRGQNARIQAESERYTTHNPLPRPPEIIPLVTSLTREHAAVNHHSAQRSIVPLGLGKAPGVAATVGTQSRSSSGSSRARAPSVHFADPPSTKEPSQSKYKVTANGEELRQENTRRPHLVVPGAPPSQRVIPPRLTNLDDSDVTPRPSLAPVPAHLVPHGSRPVWPPHLMQYAPKDTSPCVWVGDPDEPHEILPTEVPLESVLQQSRLHPTGSGVSAVVPLVGTSTITQSIIPPTMIQAAHPAAETGSACMRVAPADAPVSGRSPFAWRPGPAHKKGYVAAFLPEIGISWIPEEQASKLPVRARGTESRYPYVIAKEPSEVDDEWRKIQDGASPPSNPLQLSGVPEAPVAGPSTSVVHRGQYDPLPGSSTAVSSLFLNPPPAPGRMVAASANSSNASLSGMGILAPPNSSSRSGRSAGALQESARTANDLGLHIASLPGSQSFTADGVDQELEADSSPALSWGTIPTRSSRNSSLGNLHLNNLPSPHPFARPSESIEQLPIGELNGGPVVLTDMVTPRQTSSLFGDTASVSSPSVSLSVSSLSGRLLQPSAGSSQVVSSFRDLEDVNRSLLQFAGYRDQEPFRSEQSRSSRPSNRHSRQPSVSADESDAMVGPRTGLTLYSAKAPTQHPNTRASNYASPESPSPPAQSRPRSGASTRSHAESTQSHQSSHSNHSAHNAISRQFTDHRRRRGSIAYDFTNNSEPVAMWTQPPNTQFHSSAPTPYGSESKSQKSQESIPRAMDGLGSGPGSLSSLLLSFDPPSTSSAVTGDGEEAAGIHAPRPVNGRRSSMFGAAWNARAGH